MVAGPSQRNPLVPFAECGGSETLIRDGSSEVEIDVLQFYVPIDMECSIVPVRAFVGYDGAVLQRGKRVLRQDWHGEQENQRSELDTRTGHHLRARVIDPWSRSRMFFEYSLPDLA